MKNVTLIWVVVGLIIGLVNPLNDGSSVMNRIGFAIPWALIFGGIAFAVDLVVNWYTKKNGR